jgi:hypothetical protein
MEVLLMRRSFILSMLGLLVGSLWLTAQDDASLRSGPKAGTFLPGPFDCFMLNGEYKSRFHCLVCRYGLDPSIVVFAREPEEGKDAALTALSKRLQEATIEFKKHSLHAGIVFLSPDAQSAATNPNEKDPAKLVDEAKKRQELHDRLTARTGSLKNVDIAVVLTPGPKEYDMNPKAEFTILFYNRMRIVFNGAYAPGKLTDEEMNRIVDKVKETLEPPPPPKKKA